MTPVKLITMFGSVDITKGSQLKGTLEMTPVKPITNVWFGGHYEESLIKKALNERSRKFSTKGEAAFYQTTLTKQGESRRMVISSEAATGLDTVRPPIYVVAR